MSEANRILIVDDEATAVENLAHVCRKAGHDVTTRNSGMGAIEALQSERFDLVLTDLKMEQVDGMAVLQKAKELDPETAVVLITGFATLDRLSLVVPLDLRPLDVHLDGVDDEV